MTNAQEKRVKRIAEHKGFRLDKAGHGKGHGRFYIMNLAEGGRMRSGGLWMIEGAVLLFVVVGILGSGGQGPSRNQIEGAVSKMWATCEAQYNPQTQSNQFINCIDKLGGAYIEGAKAGQR